MVKHSPGGGAGQKEVDGDPLGMGWPWPYFCAQIDEREGVQMGCGDMSLCHFAGIFPNAIEESEATGSPREKVPAAQAHCGKIPVDGSSTAQHQLGHGNDGGREHGSFA